MYRRTSILWLVLINTGFSNYGTWGSEQQPLGPSSEDNPLDPSFDIFVEDTLRKLHVPGLSIAVIDNGKITSKVRRTRISLLIL